MLKCAEIHIPMVRGQRGHSQSQRENSHQDPGDMFLKFTFVFILVDETHSVTVCTMEVRGQLGGIDSLHIM